MSLRRLPRANELVTPTDDHPKSPANVAFVSAKADLVLATARDTIGPRDVSRFATSGAGTNGDPWVGWETEVNASSAVFWFPTGYYELRTMLDLQPYTSLRGAGRLLSFIRTASTYTGDGIRLLGTINAVDGWHSTIEDLAIVNGNSASYASVGVAFIAVAYCTIQRCTIAGWWRGVVLDQSESAMVYNNDFELGNPFTGIEVARVTSATVVSIGDVGETYYWYKIVSITDTTAWSIAVPAILATGVETLTSVNKNYIEWVASAGAVRYEIYRSYGGSSYGLIGTTTLTHFTDTGIPATTNRYGIIFPPERVVGLWIVNGGQFTAPRGLGLSAPGFTNVLTIQDNWFNGGAIPIGVLDEGGTSHVFTGGGFNSCNPPMYLAGVDNLLIQGMYFEAVAGIIFEYRALDTGDSATNCHVTTLLECFMACTNPPIQITSLGRIFISGCEFFTPAAKPITGAGNAVSIRALSNYWPGDGGTTISLCDGTAAVHQEDSFKKDITSTYIGTLTLVNGMNHNVALGGYTGIQRVSGPTGVFSIAGLRSGRAGAELRIFNPTAYTMTIVNESADGSDAAKQFLTLTGSDLVLAGPSIVNLMYDGILSQWVVAGTSP